MKSRTCLRNEENTFKIGWYFDYSQNLSKKLHFSASMCMPEVFELLSKFVAISVCHINGTDLNLIPANLRDYALHSSLPNDSHMG